MSAKPRTSELQPSSGSAKGKATILLLEEDAGTREALQKVLERGGYHVLSAQNRDEAALLANRHTGQIDLLLADLSVGRDLRTHTRELPVLYISDYPRDEEHSSATIRYIARPLRRQTLLSGIRSILDGHEASSGRIIP
jgi:two-component system response regulator FlrC